MATPAAAVVMDSGVMRFLVTMRARLRVGLMSCVSFHFDWWSCVSFDFDWWWAV